jgi:two-component system OmpR family sensor kinase
MASLRARVLASVLALSAAGLLALAAVTYTEQRSFLEGRVDQQARSATPAVSQALDAAGDRPAGEGEFFGSGGGHFDGRRSGPGPNLPPGTCGQRRGADGTVIGKMLCFTYGQTAAAAPKLPAQVPIGRLMTVGSVTGSGPEYRVYAARDPEDSGITIVAVPLTDVKQTLSRLLVVEGLVIAGVLAALGLSAFLLVRLGLRPLTRMEVTAGEIAAGKLDRRVSPTNPRTEVGRLGLALNRMLERLEQAFAEREASEERLRQFLADASHELRTPLASIRGYAELYRIGAARASADTELAMRRIEDEATRMGVLVEDLLALARLDETSPPVRRPVDLAALAGDAVQDARATAPDRSIELHTAGPALVAGDELQLRQVLGNLMRNALTHTPAASPIEVHLGADGAEISLEVRDHGPGLPEGAAEKVFGRFWRSERGRERGKAGAGLGLAIAQGVVLAHHGRIDAENAPGGGAVFRVRLPALPAEPASPAPPPEPLPPAPS